MRKSLSVVSLLLCAVWIFQGFGDVAVEQVSERELCHSGALTLFEAGCVGTGFAWLLRYSGCQKLVWLSHCGESSTGCQIKA
jgi:hypothetical protein